MLMTNSKIFQHNTYNTLYGGFYEGTITLEEALKHGSAGIGTLDTANGEVTILDGVAYHGSSENKVRIVEKDETLPYVAVVDHQPLMSFTDASCSSASEFLSALTEKLPTKSAAYSIVIAGFFKTMTISSKPAGNTEPYLDILAKQPHFTRENACGTIVGIWSPKHLADLFGDGFHLHFVSSDKTFSAHVQDFVIDKVTVEFGKIDSIQQVFPVDNENFEKHQF